jgi:hypothetical protein
VRLLSSRWLTLASSILAAIHSAGFHFWREDLPWQLISAAITCHRKFIADEINGAAIHFKGNEVRRGSIIRFQIKILDQNNGRYHCGSGLE